MYLDLDQKITVLTDEFECLQDLLREEEFHTSSNILREQIQEKANVYKNTRAELLLINDQIQQSEKILYAKQLEHDYHKHVFIHNWEKENERYKTIITAFDHRQKLEYMNNVFELLKDKENIYKEIEHIESLMPLIDEWFRGKELQLRIKRHEEALYDFQLIFYLHLEKMKKKDELSCDIERITDMEKKILCAIASLETLMAIFKTYYSWTLKKTILPLLAENTNKLLAIVCRNHRSLEIAYQTCMDDTDDLNIKWMVKDDDMIISLTKASGYQKCVVNLIIRLILGKMGVTDIYNTQFFIDEGFTACDHENLKVVPSFLQSLLYIYKSIILVTHIDELKKHFHYQIPIRRNNDTGLQHLSYMM